MRIFVLLPRVPYPLEKGDKLRAFNQIACLSKHNKIHLCALNDTNVHPDAIKILKKYCETIDIINLSKTCIYLNLFKGVFTNMPFQVHYFYNKKAQKTINHLIKKYRPQHLYCQLVRTAEYIKRSNTPKTIDYQDVFSKGIERRLHYTPFYLKPILKAEYNRLLKYENHVFDLFDNKTIISGPDREFIPHKDKRKIHIIPNGINSEYFAPREEKRTLDLVFIGNMGYPPNVNASEFLVNEILPLLEEDMHVKIYLVGASPDKKVQRLASKKVVVTGWVDDVRDYYAKAKIFIAPMQIGTGLQNKLLEAMAMKTPCITSPLANNALGAMHNKEIMVARNPGEYVEHIKTLLQNPEKAIEIAHNGHDFVTKNYNWEAVTGKLNTIIQLGQDSLA